MQSRTRMAALTAAMIAALSTAATAETVNGVSILRGPAASTSGVTVLRGRPATPSGEAPAGVGSGSSAPPRTGGYTIDQSGFLNALHTGSANAGGEIANPPPGAGR